MAAPISPRLCHFRGCGPSREPKVGAFVVINFDDANPLIPDGEDREYQLDVPVCFFHLNYINDTGRVELAYHPSLGAKLRSL